jgi:hypothetical protein
MPWTQGKLVSTIEDYMDSIADKMSRSTSNRQIQRYDNQLKGMENLAKRLGVRCDCFYTKWTDVPRTVCRCKAMTPAERRKL